jgi:hypothetical protein
MVYITELVLVRNPTHERASEQTTRIHTLVDKEYMIKKLKKTEKH